MRMTKLEIGELEGAFNGPERCGTEAGRARSEDALRGES